MPKKRLNIKRTYYLCSQGFEVEIPVLVFGELLNSTVGWQCYFADNGFGLRSPNWKVSLFVKEEVK